MRNLLACHSAAAAAAAAAAQRPCHNKGSQCVGCDGGSGSHHSDGSANEADSGGNSGSANAANFGAGGVEAAIELVLEVGEATARVREVVGVRGRERVVVAVELEEDVQGATALGLVQAD